MVVENFWGKNGLWGEGGFFDMNRLTYEVALGQILHVAGLTYRSGLAGRASETQGLFKSIFKIVSPTKFNAYFGAGVVSETAAGNFARAMHLPNLKALTDLGFVVVARERSPVEGIALPTRTNLASCRLFGIARPFSGASRGSRMPWLTFGGGRCSSATLFSLANSFSTTVENQAKFRGRLLVSATSLNARLMAAATRKPATP